MQIPKCVTPDRCCTYMCTMRSSLGIIASRDQAVVAKVNQVVNPHYI